MKQPGRARRQAVLEPVLDKVADHFEIAGIEHPAGGIAVSESNQYFSLKRCHGVSACLPRLTRPGVPNCDTPRGSAVLRCHSGKLLPPSRCCLTVPPEAAYRYFALRHVPAGARE